MKRSLALLLIVALLLALCTGCQAPNVEEEPAATAATLPPTAATPPPVADEEQTLQGFLASEEDAEYLLTEDTVLDITGITVKKDRTILMKSVSLTLTGTYSAENGCITLRANRAEEDTPTLDLSGISFKLDPAQEQRLFEIHSSVKAKAPAASSGIEISTGGEWTTVMAMPPQADPSNGGTGGDIYTAATAQELLNALNTATVSQIELTGDVAADLSGVTLSRNVTIRSAGHALALTGTLAFANEGSLVIDGGMDEAATLDLTGLSVTADGIDTAALPEGSLDLIQIRMNFKQIQGKPTLSEALEYNINNEGTQAFVVLKIAPDTTAQILKDMPLILSGELNDGEYRAVYAGDTADGVLEIQLNDPTITEEIRVHVGGGVTLKLTGSVTFDGGLYRFEFAEGEGRATVDLTQLQIKGTPAVGKTKSDNIVFWRARNGVDVLYNKTDSHLAYTAGGSGNDELRYVQ